MVAVLSRTALALGSILALTACGSAQDALGTMVAPKHSETPAPTPVILLQMTGAANAQSHSFDVRTNWELTWHATDTGGAQGCFLQVSLYGSDPDPELSVGMIVRGSQSAVDRQRNWGRFYVDVQASGCLWEVTASVPPSRDGRH